MRAVRASARLQGRLRAAVPALLLCLLAQLEVWTAEPPLAGPAWVHAGLSAAATLALLLRDHRPLAVACVAAGAGAAEVVVTSGGVPLAASVAPLVAVLALARHGGTSAAVAGGVFVLVASTVRDVLNPGVNELDIVLGWLLVAVLWVLGRALHVRSASLTSLEREAKRLREERDQQARAAVAEERARLAREIHDVVAHSISVVAVQAGAARWVLPEDNAEVREALVTIERTSREALTELRRLLEVLRSDEQDVERTPPRGIADVPALVDQVRAAGQPLTLHIDGARVVLPPGLELTAYRVVQEALTNVLKHAPGAPASVAVRCSPEQLEVEVTDSGARRGSPDAPLSGHGLLGMRERVAVYGGELQAGPSGDGFRVRARLPIRDPS